MSLDIDRTLGYTGSEGFFVTYVLYGVGPGAGSEKKVDLSILKRDGFTPYGLASLEGQRLMKEMHGAGISIDKIVFDGEELPLGPPTKKN